MIEKEIWKPIKGYEGLYEISNYGKIKSFKCRGNTCIKYCEKELKQTINKGGYLLVNLRKNGIRKSYLVHRLVAQTFIPNPDNKPCINHLDENPNNNKVNNLAWCTYKENNNYGNHKRNISVVNKGCIPWNKNKKMSSKYIKEKYYCKKVNQYDKENNLLKVWDSVIQVERELGINNANIHKCCNGMRKTAGGYIWKYELEGGRKTWIIII